MLDKMVMGKLAMVLDGVKKLRRHHCWRVVNNRAVLMTNSRVQVSSAIALAFLIIAASVNAQNTSIQSSNLWTVEVGRNSDCSPALTPDGTIFTGSWSGKFFAVTPDGKVKWVFKTGVEIKSSPAIASDGTIYFGCRNNRLYALDSDGRQKWVFQTGAWVDSSPAIGTDGTIYFGSWDKRFYALNPDGSKKWDFLTEGPVTSSPAIDAGGTIYFGSHDKKFYALNPDGSEKWSFTVGGQIISSPAIGKDGTIFFTSTDGKLYALNPDGSEKWSLLTGGVTESSPALGPDGMIYLGNNNKYISVRPDGKFHWGAPGNDMFDSTPTHTVRQVTFFCSRDGRLFAALMMPDHERPFPPWDKWLHGPVVSSPVIGRDNTLYVVGNNGKLYAIAVETPLAVSSWPMFRGNPRHTGNVADNGK